MRPVYSQGSFQETSCFQEFQRLCCFRKTSPHGCHIVQRGGHVFDETRHSMLILLHEKRCVIGGFSKFSLSISFTFFRLK